MPCSHCWALLPPSLLALHAVKGDSYWQKSVFRQKVFDNLDFLCFSYIASLFQVLDKRQSHKYSKEVCLLSLGTTLNHLLSGYKSTVLEEALG